MPIRKKTAVWGSSLPASEIQMELLPMRSHWRAVRSLISTPMENTVTMKIISISTPGVKVLFR